MGATCHADLSISRILTSHVWFTPSFDWILRGIVTLNILEPLQCVSQVWISCERGQSEVPELVAFMTLGILGKLRWVTLQTRLSRWCSWSFDRHLTCSLRVKGMGNGPRSKATLFSHVFFRGLDGDPWWFQTCQGITWSNCECRRLLPYSPRPWSYHVGLSMG